MVDLPTPPLEERRSAEVSLSNEVQRRINLIWEVTQAAIALIVVITTMIAAVLSTIKNVQVPSIVSVAFGTVVGFYFGRTEQRTNFALKPKGD